MKDDEKLKIGYLGPQGTFTQEAALRYGGTKQLVCYDTFSQIMAAVDSGAIQEGIVPLENSLEGAVVQTMDLLAHSYDIKMKAEIIIKVSQHLLVHPGMSWQQVTKVLSHPQALAQCRLFLEKQLPQAQQLETASTAEAARMVAHENQPWAAIGTEKAAQIQGLVIAQRDIQDQKDNVTRFAVLAKQDAPLSSGCKTSLIVSTANRPGALYVVLREFVLRDINLTRIESRPAKTGMGEYVFFIDLEGHRLEDKVQDALQTVQEKSMGLKIIGSYPADDMMEEKDKTIQSQTLDALRAEIDMVDAQIVDLLGIRTRLVSKVADKKSLPERVKDNAREEKVLQRVQTLALQKGAEPTMVADVYRFLMDYFVEMQKDKLLHKVEEQGEEPGPQEV